MDAFLQGLLRRYAGDGGSDDALAHQIAHTVMRAEGSSKPIPKWQDQLARPFKTFDEIIGVLTRDDIVPLGIISEWEDDHVTCGKVAFMLGDECLSFDLNYCGVTALGAFEYGDSPRACKDAIETLRTHVGRIFDFDDGEFEDWELDEIKTGGYPRLGISDFTSGYSRHDLGKLFQKHGQEAFEKAFGPLQPWTWTYAANSSYAGRVDHRWKTAGSISITPEGSFWNYYNGSDNERADNSRVIDSPSLHTLVWEGNPDKIGCWPFDD
jgi:hypothetical protein